MSPIFAHISSRIFPWSSTKSDDKNQGGDEEPDGVGEGADGDGDEDKGDEDSRGGKKPEKGSRDGPDPVSVVEKDESANGQSAEKKSLQQTYEDILFHVCDPPSPQFTFSVRSSFKIGGKPYD